MAAGGGLREGSFDGEVVVGLVKDTFGGGCDGEEWGRCGGGPRWSGDGFYRMWG